MGCNEKMECINIAAVIVNWLSAPNKFMRSIVSADEVLAINLDPYGHESLDRYTAEQNLHTHIIARRLTFSD